MQAVTVALAEDDHLFRELLSFHVRSQANLELIGIATNGQEAINLAESLRPDIFLMDLHMPVMDGIEATQKILASYPTTKIIAITTFDSYDYVSKALAAGVHGYLMKNSRPTEVKQAIEAAVEGRAIIDSRALASLVISMNLSKPPQGNPWGTLTATEQNIVKLVCLGKTNQEIASELHYSLSTVKNTLSRVYAKLDIKTRTQLLVMAGHHNFPVLD